MKVAVTLQCSSVNACGEALRPRVIVETRSRETPFDSRLVHGWAAETPCFNSEILSLGGGDSQR